MAGIVQMVQKTVKVPITKPVPERAVRAAPFLVLVFVNSANRPAAKIPNSILNIAVKVRLPAFSPPPITHILSTSPGSLAIRAKLILKNVSPIARAIRAWTGFERFFNIGIFTGFRLRI